MGVMTAISKPQDLYLPWLKGHFRWQERLARVEWSADDIITLHEVRRNEGQPDRLLFSIPARDVVRATSTIGYLRLHLPDGRNFHLGLRASIPTPAEAESIKEYSDRAKATGVADGAWWREQLQAAGVPVKHRGGKWFTGVVIGTTVAIVAGATLLVLLVGT